MKLFKLLFSNKTGIDYEALYHDSQQKLSWYIDTLETKQIQYDRIEHIASELRQENSNLKAELETLKKSILDLPKQLGKTLGK